MITLVFPHCWAPPFYKAVSHDIATRRCRRQSTPVHVHVTGRQTRARDTSRGDSAHSVEKQHQLSCVIDGSVSTAEDPRQSGDIGNGRGCVRVSVPSYLEKQRAFPSFAAEKHSPDLIDRCRSQIMFSNSDCRLGSSNQFPFIKCVQK